MLQYQDYRMISTFLDENPDFQDIVNKLIDHQKTAISTVTHEFRNSLALIDSSMQYIQKKHPEVSSFPFWKETVAEINYLERLTHAFSKEKFGDFVTLKQMKISSVIDSVHAAVRPLERTHNLSFSLSVQEPLPMIMGDEIKLRQMLLNLIRNACQAMDYCGRVYITCRCIGSEIEIRVQDTGCGLDPEIADRIFEPFISNKSDGTGLGLAITKDIVEAHGGEISVDSRPMDGCTFIIRIPIIKDNL
jgi:signal transduction histidine kinase